VKSNWLDQVSSYFVAIFGIDGFAIAVPIFDGGLPSYDPLIQLQQERIMQLCTARIAVLQHDSIGLACSSDGHGQGVFCCLLWRDMCW